MLGFVSVLLLLCGDQEGELPEVCNEAQQTAQQASSSSGGGFEERMHEFMDRIMNSDLRHEFMEKYSELYDKVMHSEFMDKVMHSEFYDKSSELYDKVMHSEFVDAVLHSKMMEGMKALPSEFLEELRLLAGLRESLLLHVERRSLIVAGVMVAVVAALLLLGCLWINWCHTEHGEYRYIPVSQVEEFLRYQNLTGAQHEGRKGGKKKHHHRGKGSHGNASGNANKAGDGEHKDANVASDKEHKNADDASDSTHNKGAGSDNERKDVVSDSEHKNADFKSDSKRKGADLISDSKHKNADVIKTDSGKGDGSAVLANGSTSTDISVVDSKAASKDGGVVKSASEGEGDTVITHRKHQRQLSNGCSGGHS